MVRIETTTSPTADDIVSFDSAVRWLRAHGVDDTQTILECLQAAVVEAEDVTNRTLRQSVTRTIFFRDWLRFLWIPKPPLQSVTSVKYYDPDGTLTTMSASDYTVKTPTRGQGMVHFAADFTFPNLDVDRIDPIEVVVVTGWGDADTIPASAKAAVRLLCIENYDHTIQHGDLARRKLTSLKFRGPS